MYWVLGDFASLRYEFTEGLDLYEVRYGFPLNAYDGTLQVRYENADSTIVTLNLWMLASAAKVRPSPSLSSTSDPVYQSGVCPGLSL